MFSSYWQLLSNLCFSRNTSTLFLNNFSSILEKCVSKETVLYFMKLCLSPVLYCGLTLAIFSFFGNEPIWNDKLRTYVNSFPVMAFSLMPHQCHWNQLTFYFYIHWQYPEFPSHPQLWETLSWDFSQDIYPGHNQISRDQGFSLLNEVQHWQRNEYSYMYVIRIMNFIITVNKIFRIIFFSGAVS